VAYELAVGAIPDGMFVCHRCDNPRRVRPSHLFLGSHAENMADMVIKGRSAHMHGDLNGRAKLEPEAIASIRSIDPARICLNPVTMAKSGIQTRRQARTWLPEFNLHLAGSIVLDVTPRSRGDLA
jgi:hypothetical protein